MARSSGYRSKKSNRKVVNELRAELAKCRGWQWQKAAGIMQDILDALGRSAGPSGSVVNPRCSKICDHFGHTAQHCPVGEMPEEKERREHYERLAWHEANPTPEYLDSLMQPWCWDKGELRRLQWGETTRSGGPFEPQGVWEYPGVLPAQEYHRTRKDWCEPCECMSKDEQRGFYCGW